MRILVVDDEHKVARALKEGLEGESYEVSLAHTGEEGFYLVAVMMGDPVLLQEEVNPVMSAMLNNGLEITALHNHFFFEEPRMFYMHVMGHGTPEDLSRRAKPGPDLIGRTPRHEAASSADAVAGQGRLDTSGRPFGGLGPDVHNWALGSNVTFPAFDLASIHARQQIEAHRELSATAQYNRILDDLRGQFEEAQAQLAGAHRVAQNTPIQLEAARAAGQQATARYNSGLGNIVELAQAQRPLKQAEIDDALARLGVWRGLLAVASAQGNLQPFLQTAGK